MPRSTLHVRWAASPSRVGSPRCVNTGASSVRCIIVDGSKGRRGASDRVVFSRSFGDGGSVGDDRSMAGTAERCRGGRDGAVTCGVWSGGGGGGWGGNGWGGGGRWGRRRGDDGDEDDQDGRRRLAAGGALPKLAMLVAAHRAAFPPSAEAAFGAASKSTSPGDMATCFLYGFTWFYGLKLFLKHLFSPSILFVGTMWLLTRMGALPMNLLPDAYAAFVKPYVPREWYRTDLEVVDSRVKTWENKFWAFVHRVLPASNHPLAEKAFFAGIILAGLV